MRKNYVITDTPLQINIRKAEKFKDSAIQCQKNCANFSDKGERELCRLSSDLTELVGLKPHAFNANSISVFEVGWLVGWWLVEGVISFFFCVLIVGSRNLYFIVTKWK